MLAPLINWKSILFRVTKSMALVAGTPPKARRPFSTPQMKLSVVCTEHLGVTLARGTQDPSQEVRPVAGAVGFDVPDTRTLPIPNRS